ncbi:MAG TPA: PIN domain-containing protein [Actinopolymorphaceae bacterium]
MGELRLGVLRARDPEVAGRRLSTYQLAQRFEPLEIEEKVSESWALLVSRFRVVGREVPLNDSWIAATAMAHGVPVMTQDADYESLPGPEVIRI